MGKHVSTYVNTNQSMNGSKHVSLVSLNRFSDRAEASVHALYVYVRACMAKGAWGYYCLQLPGRDWGMTQVENDAELLAVEVHITVLCSRASETRAECEERWLVGMREVANKCASIQVCVYEDVVEEQEERKWEESMLSSAVNYAWIL